MRRLHALSVLSCVSVLVLSSAAVLAGADTTASAARRLAERAQGNTPLIEDLRSLCDGIGGRPTGSDAAREALAWAEQRFRSARVASVRLESFEVPSLWLAGRAGASCLAPARFPIRVVSAAYSPSTPAGRPLEARLVLAGEGSPEAFERLGPAAAGAIALVRTEPMKSLADLFAEYMRDRAMLEAAARAKVSAILLMSTRPRGLLYRHPVRLDAALALMPVALASREQAARLARLAQRGEVRLRLDLQNETGPAYRSRNVVAEIAGRERPEEIVVVGAHLDSWGLGTGAQDNGVNSAIVIDLARGIMELALRPRRSVRFVLFTGEEQGMWGSAGYVALHADEMDRHVAVVILDIGSGRINGFYLNGREQLRGAVQQALAPVADLGPFHHPDEAVDGTDNFDFLLSGVPNLVADQDPAPYLPDYHAESDVYDVVDKQQAKNNEAIAAALVWWLADSPGRPAPRQSRDDVDALIRRTRLEPQMRAFGQWDRWLERRRDFDHP